MHIRIGTRGSALALTQTNTVKDSIEKSNPGVTTEIIEIKTLGDRKQGTAQAVESDKKDWVLDLELALLDSSIDLAIHSGKDVPSDIEEGTSVVSVLERELAFDVFIGAKIDGSARLALGDLPQGAEIGTASLRRKAQLLNSRPDFKIVDHRGNVPTRIRKLDESNTLSGIVLAAAGIRRLAEVDVPFEVIPKEKMLPAVNQGILAVQFASNRLDVAQAVARISHAETADCFIAERECIHLLEADCRSSVCAYAEIVGDTLKMSCRVLSSDGVTCLDSVHQGARRDAALLGRKAAEDVISQGAKEVIAACSQL